MAMDHFFFSTACAGNFDSRGVAIGPARGAGLSFIAGWRNTPSAVGAEQS